MMVTEEAIIPMVEAAGIVRQSQLHPNVVKTMREARSHPGTHTPVHVYLKKHVHAKCKSIWIHPRAHSHVYKHVDPHVHVSLPGVRTKNLGRPPSYAER